LDLFLIVIAFFGLLAIGTPIAIVVLTSSIIGLAINNIPLSMIPQTMINGINGYTLLAIPLYILAGEFMNELGVAKKIFDFALSLVGHIRGSMGHVNVIASMVFAGISGSSTADASGLGRIELKAMKDEGYDTDFSAAITAASSTVGPIIPPSIHMMIYASVAEVPAAALLIAGLVPGLLMGLGLMLTVYILAISGKVNCPVRPRSSIIKILTTFKDSFLALLAPILIVGGIMWGVVTPTEAGCIAVVYTFFLGILYKKISINNINKCLKNTIYSTGVVMFMLAVARIFVWFITIEQIPNRLMNLILSITTDRILILFLVGIFVLILGMISTASANIVLATPILLPMLSPLGVDPVHLGVILVFGFVLGIITPPVGTSLYITTEIAQIPFERLVKAIIPFYIPLVLSFYIIIYFPQISLFLPKVLGIMF
jgi:tripartite ATP-independent transporter DctM subunit